MKVEKKEILTNCLTLGYSGHKKAKYLIESNDLKQRVIGAEQILAFMLVLPILSSLGLVSMLLEYLNVWPVFEELDNNGAPIDSSIFGSEIHLAQLLGWFPQALFCYQLLHLFLALALVQHLPKLQASDRVAIIWFGLYAIDWQPSDYLPSSTKHTNLEEPAQTTPEP